jgi:prepilin-type N-terminal cleavage/methylation domain-containing protein
VRGRGTRSQRGFTLIELMISLLISSLLVIMILSIFARMSFAFREQQQIVSVQQVLSAAQGAFDRDAKLAGLLMPQGFTLAADFTAGNIVRRPAVRVVNNTTAADEVGFYYADVDSMAIVAATTTPTFIAMTVESNPGNLAPDDIVVVSSSTTVASLIDPVNDPKVIEYEACILQVDAVTGSAPAVDITFKETGTWGRTNNDHCQGIPAEGRTTVARLVAHYWRIDTSTSARAEIGVLQLDPTGALPSLTASNFEDQAYGVVDLQLATYFYEADGDNSDPNTDPVAVATAFFPPLLMTVSLVARTHANVEGVYTRNYPTLTDPVYPDENAVGDRDTVTLPSTTDPSLMGFRIYRHITFQVDLRNMGVGR